MEYSQKSKILKTQQKMKKLSIITILILSIVLFSCNNTQNKTSGENLDSTKTDEITTEEVVNNEAIEVKIKITKEEIIAIMGNDFTERTYEEEMTYAQVTELKYGEDAIVNIINKKVYGISLFTNKYSFQGIKVGDNAKISLKTLSNSFDNVKDRYSNETLFDQFIKNETKIILQFDDRCNSKSELTDETKISLIGISDTYDTTL